MATKEFAFDVKLLCSIRIKATNVKEARELLHKYLDCADTNLGAFDNGDPIVAETSLDPDTDPFLYEIDGEAQ